METRIFLPGYLGRARSYQPGLPEGWLALQAPLRVRSGGSLDDYREWLVAEILRHPGQVVLGGHSMGAAMAVMAAASVPERVSALVLVGPSGLPVAKSAKRMAHDFLRQVAAGRFRASDLLLPFGDIVRGPRAAARLGRALRTLDLSREMSTIREAGVPATVIACATDTLITPASARRMAELLGGRYCELRLEGGHVWMFGRWHLLARALADVA